MNARKCTNSALKYIDPVAQGRKARRLLLAGTHKIEIDRGRGTARLVRILQPMDTTGGHKLEDLNAVCREIYGDNWATVPYWYIAYVREQAVRVLDWISIREYL